MLTLLWEAIIGLIVGAIAKFIMPGKDPESYRGTQPLRQRRWRRCAGSVVSLCSEGASHVTGHVCQSTERILSTLNEH